MLEEKITYFEERGESNTAAVFDVVDRALGQTGSRKIVLASTTGTTARHALDRYRGRDDVRLIIVPHQYGFSATGQRFPAELVARAQAEGHSVLFATMLFHTDRLFGVGAPQVAANFLRFFCEGMKVCVEITLMAGNAGLVAPGEPIIAVAGTGRGADTALALTGATSMDPKQLHISRILCKPL